MAKFIDEAGNRYGRLVVIEKSQTNRWNQAMWLCRCDCGGEVVVLGHSLRCGETRSCGCINKDVTHGESKHPLYRVWQSMVNRCENPNYHNFNCYGGRGITVCEEWRQNIKTFTNWARESGWAKGLQIDRIDNNLGYFPDNCRFVTPLENANNRRKPKPGRSGYIGVALTSYGTYRVMFKTKLINGGKVVNLGTYRDLKLALEVRNRFIVDNSLPYEIQEYKE